jgi:hypothetical protein
MKNCLKAKGHSLTGKVLVVLLLWATPRAQGAPKPVLRHVKGFHGMELNGGIGARGKLLDLGWSYYLSSSWQFKWGIAFEYHKQRANTYLKILSAPLFSYTLYTNQSNLFISLLGGPFCSYESIKIKKKDKNSFNLGLSLGGETSFFLFHRLELLLGAGGRICFLKSPCGRLDYYLTLGLRITF